jgi:glycolate oxidase iron-sulfur subunit
MSKYQINELYKDQSIHLKNLITRTGKKSIYDAVSQCSRCGYCETICPTYSITKREPISPRGRNQIIRQLIEGKIKEVDKAAEAIKTCLLCGACEDNCYGHVPTPDIILEAKREMTGHGNGLIYNFSLFILKRKKEFRYFIKMLFFLKKIGLANLSSRLGLYHIIGLSSLDHAQKKLLNPPLKFLSEYLENDERLAQKEKINWIYFSSCGIEFIYTNVGLSTIELLIKIYGNGIFMQNHCCGLIAYNYGKLKDAKELALKNIEIYENIRNIYGDVKIIGDCSSCVAFLKNYKQLFDDDESIREKANNFSANVLDILELIKLEHIEEHIDYDKIKKENLKITIHDSCRACHAQGIYSQTREALKPILKENLIEMKDSSNCCGGAGAYSFINPELSTKVLKDKIKNIANTQANIVIASSTSCFMQIQYGLKKYYPSAKIMHYTEFIKNIIK